MAGPDLFVVCKNCGSEVSPYVTECPYCGRRLRKRAPKIERPGAPAQRRRGGGAGQRLGRLRRGEIPGIRAEARPYATIGLVAASVTLSVVLRANALQLSDVGVYGKPAGDWWKLLTASFAYQNTGYALTSIGAIALFGFLIERRHGPLAALGVVLATGSMGMLLAAAVESFPLASGGNGAALGLLSAWAVPDLLARRRGEETDSDGLGAIAIALVLLLMPIAVEQADPLVGIGGAVVGLALGFPLARGRREETW